MKDWAEFTAYAATILAVLFVLIFGVIAVVGACKSVGHRNARLNAENAKYNSTKAFYQLCSRKFFAGVVVPECLPR